MTFRVLHVCTGNICRSPVAEHLMFIGGIQALIFSLLTVVYFSHAVHEEAH